MSTQIKLLLAYLLQSANQYKEENIELRNKVLELTTKVAYLERALQESSLDDLTGLLRRKRFEEYANEQLLLLRRNPNKSLSILLVDLNFLKRLNSEYGHPGGDKVLASFAERLKKSLRDCDIVARLGGDEFVVLLPEQDEFAANTIKENLLKKFGEWKSEIKPAFYGAAIGLATTTFDTVNDYSKDLVELYQEASEAMFYNKMEQRL